MKPIELTIKGLNSFRETQTIDFAALCADGLFGIFGPTGSGKSTILDAITLALYGTVERAANHTTGILNQLEEQLAVTFTFELSGPHPIRYRAERSYRQTKDGGLRLSSCRLLKLGEAKEVLADKERDVTRAIQQILGLTHDDFTRAVVLPQGKFAEFLTLKGSDRRRMLQRLFHLEKYGDELSVRLKTAADEEKQRLQIITEKQTMLGDASEEAVQAVREQCARIEQELNEVRTRRDKTAAEKAALEQIHLLMEEKESSTQALRKLMQEEDKYQSIREKLKRAEAAAMLMPYLEAVDGAEQEKGLACQARDDAKLRMNRALTQLEEARERNGRAQQALNEKHPELEDQKQRLLQGVAIQNQLKEEQSAWQKLKERQHELQKKQDQAHDAAEQERRQIESIKIEIDKQEQELSLLEVPGERREHVQQALQEKKEIDILEHYLEEKRHEWKQIKGTLSQCVAHMDRIEKDQAASDQQVAALFRRSQSIYNRAADTEQFIRSLQAFIDVQVQKLDQEEKQEYRRRLAMELAGTLRDGEPCPVCGAQHHPHPAVHVEKEAATRISARRPAFQNAGEFLLGQLRETSILMAQLQQQAKTFAGGAGHGDNDRPPSREPEQPADFAVWEAQGIQSSLQQIELMVKEQKQDQLQLADEWTAQSEQIRKKEAEYAACRARADTYRDKIAVLEEQAKEKKEEWARRMEQWTQRYRSLTTIMEEEGTIRDHDQNAERLRQSIQLLKDQLKPLEQKYTGRQEALQASASRLSEISGRLEASEQLLRQLGGQLQMLHFDETMALQNMLQAVDKELSRLKEDAAAEEQALRKNEAAYHQIDKDYANAADRAARAEKAYQQAMEKWHGQLKESRFERHDDVRHAYLSEQQRRVYATDLENYQQARTQLDMKIQSLNEKLDGRTVSDARLADIQAAWTALTDQQQNLTQAFGAAAEAREHMEKNHQLFLELESDRRQTQQSFDDYEKLQRIFRGNAFVAFVAEEQLQQVCAAASKRLGELTHDRYILEVDEQGGFIIRDHGNGGILRPVSSLSGGETFLTSLALALSLSEQIQLRGNVPLQFFFLDEGFGSLDPQLLDTVVTALEKLHMRRLSIGVISHVPEMRERLPRRLIVTPAVPSGRGSRVHMEML